VFRTVHASGQSSLRTWILPHRRNQAETATLVATPAGRPVSLDDHIRTTASLPARDTPTLQTGCCVRRNWLHACEALDALRSNQKTAIILREIDGLSYEESPSPLGVAVGTVKSRLARARSPALR